MQQRARSAIVLVGVQHLEVTREGGHRGACRVQRRSSGRATYACAHQVCNQSVRSIIFQGNCDIDSTTYLLWNDADVHYELALSPPPSPPHTPSPAFIMSTAALALSATTRHRQFNHSRRCRRGSRRGSTTITTTTNGAGDGIQRTQPPLKPSVLDRNAAKRLNGSDSSGAGASVPSR